MQNDALEPLVLNRDAAITINTALNHVLDSKFPMKDDWFVALEQLSTSLEYRLHVQELEFDAATGPEPFADLSDA